MFISLKRIFQSGIKNFRRQGNLSVATTFVLVVTISLISLLFLCHKILGFATDEIRAKADISVYFRQDCSEEAISKIQEELTKMSEVSGVEYVSQDQALDNFIERHKAEEDLMDSLVEVGFNPFLASLNIKARDASSYEKVATFLGADNFSDSIEKVDFYKRKTVIEKIFGITSFIDKAGITVSLALILVSVLLTYNTVRLTIFSQKEEIGIARLVGASNWFVRGPFLIHGVMCGFLAFIFSLALVGGGFYFLNSKIDIFFPSFEIYSFFRNDFTNIVVGQLICALILGMIPSFFAIRKYLEI